MSNQLAFDVIVKRPIKLVITDELFDFSSSNKNKEKDLKHMKIALRPSVFRPRPFVCWIQDKFSCVFTVPLFYEFSSNGLVLLCTIMSDTEDQLKVRMYHICVLPFLS